jgi:hypothetical protein
MAIFNPVSKVHVKFGDIFGEDGGTGTESDIQELVVLGNSDETAECRDVPSVLIISLDRSIITEHAGKTYCF